MDYRVIRAGHVVTLVLAMLPFVPYIAARVTGGLPNKAAWCGGNHGPWVWSWQETLFSVCVFLLLAVLPVFTLLFGLALGAVRRGGRLAWHAILLAGLQVALAFEQFNVLFWLFD
jgi:hypothetical protein